MRVAGPKYALRVHHGGNLSMAEGESIMSEKQITLNVIARCVNGHHWVRSREDCPFCGSSVLETFEHREGDCVSCGVLCPGFALGCDSPSQITPY